AGCSSAVRRKSRPCARIGAARQSQLRRAVQLERGGRVDSVDGDTKRKRTPIRVALTTTLDAAAGEHSRPAVFLYTSYIHALEQIGLAPVLITPSHSPAAISALMDACCGLVLSGGEDVDPSRYG